MKKKPALKVSFSIGRHNSPIYDEFQTQYYPLRNKRTGYVLEKLMSFAGGSGGYAIKKLPILSGGMFIIGGMLCDL